MKKSLEEIIDIIKSDSNNFLRVLESYGIKVNNNKCKCVFHNDNEPSMGIKDNRYKCFTCNASGDLIDFVSNYEGLNNLDSVKKIVEVLGLNLTVEKSKLDNLKEYIEHNFKTYYNDDTLKYEDSYFYKDENSCPILVRIKFKSELGKKHFSQANIVDMGEYYKLDFKSEKHNLLYNMPKIKKAIQEDKEIYIVEGEKDADNLASLGYTTTTCREINSTNSDILSPLVNANIVILGDNDKEGKKHIYNLRYLLKRKASSFKVPYMKEIIDIGEKADISDFIEKKRKEGLSNSQIKKLIDRQVKRTLDEKDENELQQDFNGVYYIFCKYDKEGNLIDKEKRYICNFNVISLVRIENVDTDEEIIELELVNNLGEKRLVRGKSNKIFLDSKSFNSFLNMGFAFDGKVNILNRFKNWVNKYFLVEKRNEYLITGIRNIDNKRMLITPNGALLKDGTIDMNYKADNQLTLIDYTHTDRLTKEEADELVEHIFSWNSEKNCYNVMGSLVANMFNSIYRETDGINVHVTSYVGESGSGKSFTIDNIARTFLGLDNDTMVFSSIMAHGLLRSLADTYLTNIIDEVKPSQAGDYKKQLLSNTIRSITGDSVVVKGTQSQGFKTYKYNSSLIIAGEETLDETALKNRCNIIWFSCNDMTKETIEHGNYFLTHKGKRAMKKLGMEIYLEIMNNWDSERLLKALGEIETLFQADIKMHPRIQATFNNTMLGYKVLRSVLKKVGANIANLRPTREVSELIYQNLNENVIDGEYATKQVYDEILESIDELASGSSQFTIAEDLHFTQDAESIKLDFKSIFPILEAYYKFRGQKLSVDRKTFVKMLTKSKYVEGKSTDYCRATRINGKVKKCYILKKENLISLDMPNLVPSLELLESEGEIF